MRVCKYHVDLEYRNAGQGLFYTGIFNALDSSQTFSVVYDCGTLSNRGSFIIDAINEFKTELLGGPLDLLIVSHFDTDHINYIDHLINTVGPPKLAIIPYLTPEEILIAHSIANGLNASDEVLSLIIDPSGYLSEKGVSEIIILHPSDKEGSQGGVEGVGLNLFNGLTQKIDEDNSGTVKHYKDEGFISIGTLWKFKFFHKSPKPIKKEKFKTEIRRKFKIRKGEKIEPQKLITLANAVDDIRKIYEDAFGKGGKNNTSIVVHHFKYCNNHSITSVKSKYSHPLKNRNPHSYSHHLLTGDLKVGPRCYDQIIKKWCGIENEKLLSVQIPHHGAKNYIDKKALEGFKNVKYWVINFGLGNRDKHPAQITLDLINSSINSGQIALNHQYACFKSRTYIYD